MSIYLLPYDQLNTSKGSQLSYIFRDGQFCKTMGKG